MSPEDLAPVGGRSDAALDTLTVHRDTARLLDPAADDLAPGAAFRCVPLLAVLEVDEGTVICVGQCSVVVEASGRVHTSAYLRGLWSSPRTDPVGPGAPEPGARRWRGEADAAGVAEVVQAWLAAGRPGSPDADPEARATQVAKAVAEQSRNAVESLRALRYEIEGHLSATIRGESRSRLDVVLADLVELSVVAGRTRDEARTAVREGLTAWRTDRGRAAYHARRRMHDRTLPERPGAGTAVQEEWFATYDAGIRQCEAAERLLDEELQLLQGRLAAASTVATARDAQAQESLTLLATVGGVALGVPGVIVGLYGVSDVLPLRWDARSAAVVFPLALAGLLAAVLAFALTPGTPGRRLRRSLQAFGWVLLLVVVVAFAGYWFPAR